MRIINPAIKTVINRNLGYCYISTSIISSRKDLCLKVRDNVWSDLIRFGKRAVVDIYPLGRACELNQPFMRTFDAWGNRTDELGKIMKTVLTNYKLKLSISLVVFSRFNYLVINLRCFV